MGGILVAALTAGLVELTTGAVGKFLADDEPAGCPGTDCDGRDPQVAGCGADASTVQPAEDNPVSLQIRHSPRCHAVWGRILDGEPGDRVTLEVAGGSRKEAEIRWDGDVFTNMAGVANDAFEVTVCALPTREEDRTGTWESYCISASHSSPWR
ncbi:DUF2690 domain-containing protein [Streptomyces sodiiphilus]|uniref:DUF2690 domain-containing protein n=1 Tax=Streptomyces sodiiphilus TaxID=226217 RepID=UPI0031D89F9E